MDIAIPVLLKPLLLLVLLGTAVYLSRAIRRWIPAGRLRDALYRRHAVVPTNEAERRDWTAPIACFVAGILVLLWIAWLGRDVL